MPNPQPILTDLINNIKTDVINSMQSKGRYATGETVAALETVVNDDTGQLLAPAYIDALELGRGPTSPGATAGDPPLIDKIKEWTAAKGIDINPYAITKQIHKQGYPGKPGVLTEPLSDDNINMRVDEAMEIYSDQLAKEVLDLFGIMDVV